jgi:hypothetical protein
MGSHVFTAIMGVNCKPGNCANGLRSCEYYRIFLVPEYQRIWLLWSVSCGQSSKERYVLVNIRISTRHVMV